MMFRLESLNKIFVICTLYFVAYWNIEVTFLCSSNSTSIHCTDPSVWNLGVWPLELVFNEPKLLCVIQISPNTFMHVAEHGFKGNIPSFFYGDGTDCYTFGGSHSKSYIYSFDDN